MKANTRTSDGRKAAGATQDIRVKPYLDPDDVLGLDFILKPPRYVFRRHHHAGLRSHIMAVLSPEAVRQEKEGCLVDGLRHFPRASPLKMLRLFRCRFGSLREAEEELSRVKSTIGCLGAEHVALSEEFLAEYRIGDRAEILLCGLQEYVEGVALDPWGSLGDKRLEELFLELRRNAGAVARQEDVGCWVKAVRAKAAVFAEAVKRLIADRGLIPDLAGIGNLLLEQGGGIQLVDINNISRVTAEVIHLDDQGYPVCDKSVEALFRIEKDLARAAPSPRSAPYRPFLEAERVSEVERMEKRYVQRRNASARDDRLGGRPRSVASVPS